MRQGFLENIVLEMMRLALAEQTNTENSPRSRWSGAAAAMWDVVSTRVCVCV